MVSDLNLSNSGNNTDHQEPVRIIHNHNIKPQAIRDLIKLVNLALAEVFIVIDGFLLVPIF